VVRTLLYSLACLRIFNFRFHVSVSRIPSQDYAPCVLGGKGAAVLFNGCSKRAHCLHSVRPLLLRVAFSIFIADEAGATSWRV
jgi:hypothetical protein